MKQQSKESHRQKMLQRLRQIYERRRSLPRSFDGISELDLFHAQRSQDDRLSVFRYLRSRHKQTFDDWIEIGCILFLAGFTKKDFKLAPGKPIPPFQYATARKLIQLAESDRINDPRFRD